MSAMNPTTVESSDDLSALAWVQEELRRSLDAAHKSLRRFAKPHKLTPQAIDDIERASFGLLDYLARMLAGKPVSTLALFPQYRAVQEAAGAERVHLSLIHISEPTRPY